MKLDSLRVVAFRGLRDEQIPFGGKSLLLYGENGTGKSSVVDALEFLATGSVGHLDDSQATSTRRHAPHVALPAATLSVAAHFRGFEDPCRRAADGTLSGPHSARAFVELLGRSNIILRRAQLLKFIATQDAPRYQQLSALIGADALDAVELKWKEAADAAEASRERHAVACTQLRQQLEAVLGPLPTLSERALLERANARLGALREPPLESLADAEARRQSVIAGSGQRAQAERAVALKARLTTLEQVRLATADLLGCAAFWDDTHALQSEIGTLVQSRLLAVWRSARELLVSHPQSDCPVCEQPINPGDLSRSLAARISASEAIAARIAVLTSAKNHITATLQSAGQASAGLVTQLLSEDRAESAQGLKHFADSCASWTDRFRAPVSEIDIGSFARFAHETGLSAVSAHVTAETARAEEELTLLTASEADDRIVMVADVLGRVSSVAPSLLASSQALGAQAVSARTLQQVHSHLVSARKRRVQQVYDTLEADITAFYQAIHPDEPYGAVKLIVSPTRRGSAAIRTSFACVEDVDPRAYNSEAHLDSLGLCIFLAFVKHFSGGVPMLVLDDVVSSVDAAHRTRICRLLLTRFADYQLIVTTHDALWFEEFIHIARALRYSALAPLRITSWSLEDGPRWAPWVDRWSDMRTKAAADDKQGAASLARHALEGLLFKLAVNLQASIVLRADGRYDVGSLLEPVLARARKLYARFEDDHREALTQFRSTALLGNLLTHNNPIAAGTSRQEVIDFVEAVAGLHAIFHCPNCDQLMRYMREARVVQCECGPTGRRWDVA